MTNNKKGNEEITYSPRDFGIDVVGEPPAAIATPVVATAPKRSKRSTKSADLEALLNDKFSSLQSTLDQRLAPLERAVYGEQTSGQNAPTPEARYNGNPVGTGGRIASYDKRLGRQEGQGIGDIQSNAELAQLQLDSEEPQAQVVGEEANLDEKMRLNLLEEKSHLLPVRVGPDKNGRYLPLLHSSVEVYKDETGKIKRDPRDNNLPMYKVKATYGYRWWEWMFFGKGRGINKDSMMNNIYNHAKNARVPFGSYFSRRELNPSIAGDDFSLTIYGPWRENLLKGFVTGNRVEIDYIRPMSDTKMKRFILALEPDSGAYRAAEEDNA